MKRYDNDDELERALFNLELEEPPADLRASILNATVYAPPVTAAATFPAWEVSLYGGLCAVLVWMLIAILKGFGAHEVEAATSYGAHVLAYMKQPAVLFWIAIGGAAAWISQVNLTGMPGYQRAARR